MPNDHSKTSDAQGTLMLCRLCWQENGATIEQWAECASESGVQVQMVDCMAACDHGPSGAIAAPGAWTYLLGNLAETDIDTLLWGASSLSQSVDGLLPWDGRPSRYRQIIRGRIPPLATDQ
ncbi:DUF1636 family protein [Notoacmeibacter sp. MSK16QG-6]|uniref:DUF1636 family protein n=1 Tax=Notoacmeibacter sp. MSK16QG-6 TaxID=2957982 RepID=UPI0020A1B060|nr:DUF1636 family protein [Notoacmeibacter sp. MSK16QG-6]